MVTPRFLGAPVNFAKKFFDSSTPMRKGSDGEKKSGGRKEKNSENSDPLSSCQSTAKRMECLCGDPAPGFSIQR